MRHFIFFITILISTLSFSSCKEKSTDRPLDKKELLKNMAAIDKALIPALYLTSINKQFSSLEALSKLKPQINHFIQKYENKNPSDQYWNRDIDNIKAHIKYADEHVKSNHLKQANIQDLDPLSESLIKMRNRNSLGLYYPDALKSLHSMAQSMASSLNGNIPEDAFQTVLQSTQNMLKLIKQNFEQIKAAKLDNTLYQIPQKKRQYLQQVFEQAEKAFVEIDSSITSGDKARIQHAYRELPKHFVEAYLVFGDFESLQGKK